MSDRTSESGNALWFILLAIVLMGALTLTLSRGGSTSDQTGDFEQMRIRATKVLRTGASVEQAVTNLKMRNGCSENDISFYVSTEAATASYEHTAEQEKCQVFHRNGGAINWPGAEWRFVTGSVEMVGTTATELLALMPDISADLCKAINHELSLAHPVTDNFTQTAYDVEFVGAFSENVALGDDGTFPAGRRNGCFQVAATPLGMAGQFVFYHVLMVR